ncbi:hypothetical protein [Chloroflexus sp.]|uniref:hypothetical protein n=1 Tax=Chloroflexus sp. TaxID=1904827 RepID=UPI002ACF05E2|nr:hypothetical protein [Chloroflexus sp.]
MPTIRVSAATHALLRDLAQQRGVSLQAVLAAALEHYRRQQVLAATNAAYAALRADLAQWAELERERAAWDHTIADGLADRV